MKLKITCPNCKKEFEANIEGANMPKGTYFLVPMEEMDTKTKRQPQTKTLLKNRLKTTATLKTIICTEDGSWHRCFAISEMKRIRQLSIITLSAENRTSMHGKPP